MSGRALGKHERDEVSEVQRVGRWSAPRVEVERLLLLIAVEHGRQVTVRKKDAATQEMVHWPTSQALDARQQLLRGRVRVKAVRNTSDAMNQFFSRKWDEERTKTRANENKF